MLRGYWPIIAAGCVLVSGCATSFGGEGRSGTPDTACTNRPTDALATMDEARTCIEAYRIRYSEAATANGEQRRGLRAATLVGSLGAVANALTDGSEGGTTALGLLAGTSATLSPIVAPPARVPIYLDGQRAANCLFRASSQAMDRTTRLAGEPFTSFETQVADLQGRLSRAPEHVGASTPLVTRFEDIRSSINDLVALRDSLQLARSSTRLAGDQLMSSLIDVDLAVQLRLHRVDVSLESSIQAANQSVLTLAGQMTQRPDLFSMPDQNDTGRGVLSSNPLDPALSAWNRETRAALVPVTELAATVTALLDSLEASSFSGDVSHCVDMAAGLTSDVIVLRRPPVNIDLGDTATHTVGLDVDGGNAPYTAQWIGSAPDGLTLNIEDSGSGEFEVVADPQKAVVGRYQLLLRDEDLRPLLVTLRVVGTAPPAEPEAVTPEPVTGANAGTETPAAQPNTPLVENGTPHAVCEVKAGLSEPFQGIAAVQAGICHQFATAEDFGQTQGYTFVIDGAPGSQTEAAARLVLSWRGLTDPDGLSGDALYAAVCRDLSLDNCTAAPEAP
ncbi:hypothetical protein [Maricaulis sp.]|uniref:hypothetical protein n=1 Tax=Maricaulis sp. TaxID=1486257 RepID=UPI0025C6D75C|nr:hypothetical protein [Maricaulis sp.]